jgi:hypothetical protein
MARGVQHTETKKHLNYFDRTASTPPHGSGQTGEGGHGERVGSVGICARVCECVCACECV